VNPFLGEIRLMSFNFAPKGWAQCAGQTLSVQQNTALFALLGTYYGGNGVNTFQLPDLRSRVPIHMGSGPFGSYVIGEQAGVENVSLQITQIPDHNHSVAAINSFSSTNNAATPSNNTLAQSGTTGATEPCYAGGGSNVTTLNQASIQPTGNSLPHVNIQPYLAMNYCIAMSGIFPSRG
jgi:microcystin-dependent protein